VTTRPHALCGASSAERWLNCPGSLYMQRNIPDVPSRYAAEGTAAHGEAELYLNQWLKSRTLPAIENEHIAAYVRECIQEAARLADPAIRVELRLTLDAEMSMFGTADFVATSATGDAVILDLKYGKGVPVSADSPQLAYYAVALWRTSKRDLRRIKVKVVQPRYAVAEDRVKETLYELEDLRNWYCVFTKGAEKALFQLMMKQPELKAGKWCQFCRAKSMCPERGTANPSRRSSAVDDFAAVT
jgi:CRISPR/Cas system-associated exonuclease Cas4 (RecB family)